MDKKEFRPGNIVRSKVEYSGWGLELQEGEVFELPNAADTIHSWQDHGASGSMSLSDCEPVKADLFSLKKLRFEQKPSVSINDYDIDVDNRPIGRSHIDFVYNDNFTVRFIEWRVEKDGKLIFETTVELMYGKWHKDINKPHPMKNEIEFIHEVQNWYYLFTGDEITIKGE